MTSKQPNENPLEIPLSAYLREQQRNTGRAVGPQQPFACFGVGVPRISSRIALAAALVLFGSAGAYAGDILRGGTTLGGRSGGAQQGGTINAAAVAAKQNAEDTLARTTQAINSVKAMQDAARTAAAAKPVLSFAGRTLPAVPNGLGVGGLQVAPGVPADLANPQVGEDAKLWVGAGLPSQTEKNGKALVTIRQLKPQAVLNWKTFNISKDTTLRFDQSAGKANKTQWTAFNKITDPSGQPSQILGRIEAPGQVYLINQNGILFGGTSQINLHGLFASSLPINDNLIARGLLNNPDVQFLFSALPLESGANGTPAFTPPPAPNTLGGKLGDVVVQKGAVINSPTTPEHVGGRVALIGPNVRNEGTISTPDGQAILAAGLQVGVSAHLSSDPTLRGLDVFVGAVARPAPAPVEGQPPVPAPARYAGTVTNTGLLDAPRANVTMTGMNVNQLGVIASSTSVSLNGRIDLRANYNAVGNVAYDPINLPNVPPFLSRNAGTVTFGPDSVSQILPEADSSQKVVGTQLALRSQVVVQGQAVHFANNSMLIAPNAVVDVSAGTWKFTPSTTKPISQFIASGGQIYLDEGAHISVAGSTAVEAPVTENILAVKVLGSEVADSPVQRNGPFRGNTLMLDLRIHGPWDTTLNGGLGGYTWVGTPLADARGYVGIIQRTAAQLTVDGGSVKLSAGGSIVMLKGSAVDVSGGYINYTGAMVETSRVILDGRIVDVSQATPDRVYEGIYTATYTVNHPKYSVTKTFANTLPLTAIRYEQGYTEGARGGSITISAPSMALDGTLLGSTIVGPRQRTEPPAMSSLSLTFQAQDPSIVTLPYYSPTPPDIVFQSNANLTPVGPFSLNDAGEPQALKQERLKNVVLSPDLVGAYGFGTLIVDNSDGDISVPAGVMMNAFAKGTVSLKGANVDIEGNISVPGGSISLSAFQVSANTFSKLNSLPGGEAKTPSPDQARGRFTLGAMASLSAAGLIVDDRITSPTALTLPLVVDGGSITVSGYSADLASGSEMDASGGVVLSPTGKRTFGNGGSITIKAGQDANIASVIGGTLKLGSTLKGFSGAKGGSLSILAPAIQIGGRTDNPDTLLLTPDFFNQGGFGSFSLSGLGMPTADPNEYIPGVLIAPGTVIEPVAQNYIAEAHAPTGGGIKLIPMVLPQALRTPVSLAFNAVGVRDPFKGSPLDLVVRGDFMMGKGSSIQTDPKASVNISGDTAAVLGSVIAPGGSISISGGRNFPALSPSPFALPTVNLGPQSLLSTAGTTVYTPNIFGARTGSVLPGGSISVSGNIVAEKGAVLDVSGASAILDLAPAVAPETGLSMASSQTPVNSGINSSLYASRFVPTRVDSDAGTITLRGTQELLTDATLRGAAGGPTALGGSLVISSGRFTPVGTSTLLSPLEVTMQVKQSGATIPVSFYAAGQTAIGHAVRDAKGDPIFGTGYFAVDRFAGGGFDSLALKGTVQFTGPVSINARRTLAVADGGVIYGDSAVNLSAAYVTLGTPFLPPALPQDRQSPFLFEGRPFYIDPTFGKGSLTVKATLIDIGSLSLQGIGRANFFADGGDIRGDGALSVAGDIVMRAAQIYPPTAVSFTITAADYKTGDTTNGGSVTLIASGSRQLPLSAGGSLNIYGSTIKQDGILRAPIGQINLGWDGSGTGPVDPVSGMTVATTRQLTLTSRSVTSVAAYGPQDGGELLIPYGIILNGTAWIDPAGLDITAGGVAGKNVNLSAARIATQPGSSIDLRGGGDLYAYRWVAGNGGSKDILASSTSFAVIPNYDSNYTPFAPFNPSSNATNLGGDAGYLNSSLKIGDRVHLGASDGLPEGDYTLLPARYALMPGAFLVTPQSGTPYGTVTLAEGSSLVSGYRFNDLNTERTVQALVARFEVAPSEVVRNRSEYDQVQANDFLRTGAIQNETTVPRLPTDAGHLVFQASTAMVLQGSVSAQGMGHGRGGLVDISSPVDIVISSTGSGGGAGTLNLNAAQLSKFGAESLLIGGTRKEGADGTTINVKSENVTLDNAGTPLSGPEIILVAKNNLTLAPGAEIQQIGRLGGRADTLLLGDAKVAGSGDGTLLRVSSDPSARIVRSGLGNSTVPKMTIGAGANISGASITLDSTYATSLDPSATLTGTSIALNSGQISIQFDNPGTLQPTTGLVLAGETLKGLQGSKVLSLLSYTSLDFYGAGRFSTDGSLTLHAAEIRGFNNGGGTLDIFASNILLDNSPNGSAPGPIVAPSGKLAFHAGSIRLGENQLKVDQFTTLELDASSGMVISGVGGLTAQRDIVANTPFITAARSATQSIVAGGSLTFETPTGGATTPKTAGLGASLTLKGTSIIENSDIMLPSGVLTLHATSGDVSIGGRLDVGGKVQTFFDLVKYTDGGKINLLADNGSVSFLADSTLRVAAEAGGGNAGSVSVVTPHGDFTLAGTMFAKGVRGGSFSIDVGESPSLVSLNSVLDAASFTDTRSFRVRSGDVLFDGAAKAHRFNISADTGSITVTGNVDASGERGGVINLIAGGSVTLSPTAMLSVAAQSFDNAGKGGTVSLEAGSQINGNINSAAILDIQSGSKIDLTVAAVAGLGQSTGTLHLRAPQTSGGANLALAPVNGTINGASSIVVEGYRIFDLTSSGGALSSTVQGNVRSSGITFGNNATTIEGQLLANNSDLSSVLHIRPGAEIINRTGNLTLSADWDLANSTLGAFRFGPTSSEPGILTLRAAGNLVFNGSLSDGFGAPPIDTNIPGVKPLWEAQLLAAGTQSWSYRLAAGADFGAADFRQVAPLANLGNNSGSLLLGVNGGANASFTPGPNALASKVIAGRYQVIRTGTGDIEVAAGRDVQFLNVFASIYTAGTQVAEPTLGGTFDTPSTNLLGSPLGALGAIQDRSPYAVQYTLGGGNVTISAQGDIAHYTRNSANLLVPDSQRELPSNWLYRRGYVDPVTGQFGVSKFGEVASTTWWVNFSNFFQSVGALGGGNVTMIAGNNVSNVDAVIPTNARMPKGVPNAAGLVELGGGDLIVSAGHDIDGGVYYVERGTGTLDAGFSIHTNATRSPSLTNIAREAPYAAETWLPTTLFAGKSSFDVEARGDLLLGPMANAFLLPQGYSNTYWYKTYFSTYSADSSVSVASLTGDVTFRSSATMPNTGSQAGSSTPLLDAWLQNVLLLSASGTSTATPTAAYYQPWLRTVEDKMAPFAAATSLRPPTLRTTAFSGDINLVGDLTLSASPRGTVDLAAAGSINGLQINGINNINGSDVKVWGPSQINLSDSNPASMPGIGAPYGYQTIAGVESRFANTTDIQFLKFVDKLYNESGSTLGAQGSVQNKQALHAPGVLHSGDTDPVHLYAGGDVSGLTLFSSKSARILAGHDITDIGLYIQNIAEDDISVVASGRDIVAFNPNSPLLVTARTEGNALNFGVAAQSGDLQISGPGMLQVLAGRDLDLGVGRNPGAPADTNLGLYSIGNSRNPFLPFDGAGIIAAAGIGGPTDLANSALDFTTFTEQVLTPDTINRYLAEIDTKNTGTTDVFTKLPSEKQAGLALDIFYRVLRDAGRDFSTKGNYDSGYSAIDALFPTKTKWKGDISLTSREIKTKSGGDISLIAPGGGLVVGFNATGAQAQDQGILTESGGNISIFTDQSVTVGTSRIFTLRGGNEIIWSSKGDIAAGAASKTVQSAPPTRVVIDPQSADVQTDLAGLATGGGIGVLATVAGVKPGDVDLIAPAGTIDAGDAGIRVSGNLNIAANSVLNTSNIQVAGSSAGTPAAPSVSAAPVSAPPPPPAPTSGAAGTTDAGPKREENHPAPPPEVPSIIVVEVLGYGGGDDSGSSAGTL